MRRTVRLTLALAATAVVMLGFGPAASAAPAPAASALAVRPLADVSTPINTWVYDSAAISGGTKPYTVTFTGLPAGVHQKGHGYAGYDSGAGAHQVTVAVSDSAGATVSVSFTIAARTDTPVVIGHPGGPFTLPVGDTISELDIDFSGGSGTYTYTWQGLPPGLTYAVVTAQPFLGYLSGTLTRAGTYHPVLTVKDSRGATTTWKPTFTIS